MRGLLTVLGIGYFYGIVRSNIYDSFSQFIFDAAVLGFYLGCGNRLFDEPRDSKLQALRRWIGVLIAWPVLMTLLPIQAYVVQLLGLRGNIFFLPFLVCGFLLDREEGYRFALGLAVLNLVALVFGLAEFALGIEPFYPDNPSTDLIYRSRDVVSGEELSHRIPATFPHAHGYATTMYYTMPWLIGGLLVPSRPASQKLLLSVGLFAAILGGLLSAARSWIPPFFILILYLAVSGRLKSGAWIGVGLIIGSVFYLASGEERLQRFTTLADPEFLADRLYGSVNLSFVDLIEQYPLGNGIGGGGTSVPVFLQVEVRNPVGIENEFSRILLEQGFPGLLLWVGFVVWLMGQFPARRDTWDLGRELLWLMGVLGFVTAVIGTGLMIGVPGSAMFFLGIGFVFSGRNRSAEPVLPSA